MLVNAKIGATQLLESIDKILQYSRVSGQPTSSSELCPTKEVYMPGLDNHLPERDADQDRGDILQVGRRPGEEGTVSGHTDLIGFCEEMVEDVSKRMQLSDTIMSPGLRRRTTNESYVDSARAQPEASSESEGADEGYSQSFCSMKNQ
ncbi:hypothetical protein MBLNU13_g04227t1 [Cladosporium sp. NU13]